MRRTRRALPLELEQHSRLEAEQQAVVVYAFQRADGRAAVCCECPNGVLGCPVVAVPVEDGVPLVRVVWQDDPVEQAWAGEADDDERAPGRSNCGRADEGGREGDAGGRSVCGRRGRRGRLSEGEGGQVEGVCSVEGATEPAAMEAGRVGKQAVAGARGVGVWVGRMEAVCRFTWPSEGERAEAVRHFLRVCG